MKRSHSTWLRGIVLFAVLFVAACVSSGSKRLDDWEVNWTYDSDTGELTVTVEGIPPAHQTWVAFGPDAGGAMQPLGGGDIPSNGQPIDLPSGTTVVGIGIGNGATTYTHFETLDPPAP